MKNLFLLLLVSIFFLSSSQLVQAKELVNKNYDQVIQISFIPEEDSGNEADLFKGPTNDDFDDLNPLVIAESDNADQLSTPGGIVSRILAFLFPLAGLMLFLLISWGGFEILMNSSNQKGMEAGKNRVTAAVIGFILLFATYWMAQIVEIVFGITIL